jgi:alanyl-tRNA synthetase
LASELGISIDLEEYNSEFSKHQDLSRSSPGNFKSGLADSSESTKKLHTATHLLNEALRKILKSKDIKQKGSNITPERLRFDFSFPRKLTKEELSKIEDEVNSIISQNLPIHKEEIPLSQALKSGAQAEFGARYPEMVSVYTIGNLKTPKDWYSKEICTGPHVSSTAELGKFKIKKEESSSSGVRRIKAVLE